MIKLTAAKCPQCGADIEVNKTLEKTICQYCGTTILVEEAVQKLELSGKVKVAGIKNRDDYLEQAKKHFKVGEYIDAKMCLFEILTEDSFDVEAFCELVKNDLELLKLSNFNLDISKNNSKYSADDREVYDEAIEMYDRVVMIDDNNERAAFLGGYEEEIAKYKEKEKEIEARLKENEKIVNQLNEDFDKIKKCEKLDDYNNLIGEVFHTTTHVTSTNYSSEDGCEDYYIMTGFSRITQDGIIYINYQKCSARYSFNPNTVELYWGKRSVPVSSYDEIDKRFEEYKSKIGPIIEKAKSDQVKIDKHDENVRKGKMGWYIFNAILSTSVGLIVLGANVLTLIYGGIGWLIAMIIVIDSWLARIVFGWIEISYEGISDNKKLK